MECFYLICENDSHVPISLPDLEPVAIGRNIQTKIQDLTCSRKQVVLTAVKDAKEVIVTVLGNKPSCVDGVTLHQGQSYIARNDSMIEVLVGKYIHKIKLQANTSSAAACVKRSVNDLETHGSKKIKLNAPLWEEIDGGILLIFTSEGNEDKEKIAAFDLDGTLINTKSGRIFPIDTSDWVIANDRIKEKLGTLHKDGYKIVIFTNQNGIGRQAVDKKLFKKKIENIVGLLNVPIEVYLSTKSTIYRKPAPGMWNSLLQKSTVSISVRDSFFVGDAAGRPAHWAPGRKKDFSMSDRLFAENLGLKFHTPEEFFFGKPVAPFDLPKFIPSNLICEKHKNYGLDGTEREVILMVGCPGSGKTHFVKHHLQTNGYISFSRDSLKTNDKVLSSLEKCLSSSNSKIVVDNTNPTIEARKKFISICCKHKVSVRCFIMDTSTERCHHNNKFREFTDKLHVPVSPMVINGFKKAFQQPTLKEGFAEVVSIPFIPEFKNPKDEKLYKMHLQ